jgi:hypothetical protein
LTTVANELRRRILSERFDKLPEIGSMPFKLRQNVFLTWEMIFPQEISLEPCDQDADRGKNRRSS